MIETSKFSATIEHQLEENFMDNADDTTNSDTGWMDTDPAPDDDNIEVGPIQENSSYIKLQKIGRVLLVMEECDGLEPLPYRATELIERFEVGVLMLVGLVGSSKQPSYRVTVVTQPNLKAPVHLENLGFAEVQNSKRSDSLIYHRNGKPFTPEQMVVLKEVLGCAVADPSRVLQTELQLTQTKDVLLVTEESAGLKSFPFHPIRCFDHFDVNILILACSGSPKQAGYRISVVTRAGILESSPSLESREFETAQNVEVSKHGQVTHYKKKEHLSLGEVVAFANELSNRQNSLLS